MNQLLCFLGPWEILHEDLSCSSVGVMFQCTILVTSQRIKLFTMHYTIAQHALS